ncbi:SDR family NAD(P)-dependent oxidoreductase [Rhizobium ruizarguesonis]
MGGRLRGKNILITGAAQGIGLAMAKAFMREDAAVFLVDRDAALLAQERKSVVNGKIVALVFKI